MFIFLRYVFIHSIPTIFPSNHFLKNLPAEERSRDITLRAAVFSFNVYVTSTLGFFTRLPSVDLAHVSP